jgi:hypothetical protein
VTSIFRHDPQISRRRDAAQAIVVDVYVQGGYRRTTVFLEQPARIDAAHTQCFVARVRTPKLDVGRILGIDNPDKARHKCHTPAAVHVRVRFAISREDHPIGAVFAYDAPSRRHELRATRIHALVAGTEIELPIEAELRDPRRQYCRRRDEHCDREKGIPDHRSCPIRRLRFQ